MLNATRRLVKPGQLSSPSGALPLGTIRQVFSRLSIRLSGGDGRSRGRWLQPNGTRFGGWLLNTADNAF